MGGISRGRLQHGAWLPLLEPAALVQEVAVEGSDGQYLGVPVVDGVAVRLAELGCGEALGARANKTKNCSRSEISELGPPRRRKTTGVQVRFFFFFGGRAILRQSQTGQLSILVSHDAAQGNPFVNPIVPNTGLALGGQPAELGRD